MMMDKKSFFFIFLIFILAVKGTAEAKPNEETAHEFNQNMVQERRVYDNQAKISQTALRAKETERLDRQTKLQGSSFARKQIGAGIYYKEPSIRIKSNDRKRENSPIKKIGSWLKKAEPQSKISKKQKISVARDK